MCRSRRELSNEYLLAKFGFDTAENEACKVCPLSVYIIMITDPPGGWEVNAEKGHEGPLLRRGGLETFIDSQPPIH